jgi:Cu(I)/Ag(I) efflux system membrane fusion protein
VIETGTKSVVFVALADGKFQPREVRLGESDGAWTAVVLGLEAGEGVVTRANFLVDSESRMRASLEALTATAPTSAAAPATPPAGAAPPAADPHAGHKR